MNTTANPVEAITPAEESPKDYYKRILGESNFYRHVARELMQDARRLLGISQPQAERLGRQFLVDLGRYQKEQAAEGVSFGKSTKDGMTTLRVTIAKIKGVHFTPTFSIAKICAMLNDASEYGIEKFGSITLSSRLEEWLAEK